MDKKIKTINVISEGITDAVEYARIQRIVYEWIRDDVPLAAKMNLMPNHVNKLIDRICGSRTHIQWKSDGTP